VLDVDRRHPRKQIATVPVIVLSALSSSKLQNELLLNGVVHCLGKPFSVTELCLLVNSLLGESSDPAWSSPL
jgi:DNA-binding response OmpR family regulator